MPSCALSETTSRPRAHSKLRSAVQTSPVSRAFSPCAICLATSASRFLSRRRATSFSTLRASGSSGCRARNCRYNTRAFRSSTVIPFKSPKWNNTSTAASSAGAIKGSRRKLVRLIDRSTRFRTLPARVTTLLWYNASACVSSSCPSRHEITAFSPGSVASAKAAFCAARTASRPLSVPWYSARSPRPSPVSGRPLRRRASSSRRRASRWTRTDSPSPR